MAEMRVLFVLSMVLSVSTPQISWVAIEVQVRDTGSAALGSSSTAASQIVRAVAKVDQTFSSGAAIAPAGFSIELPVGSTERTLLRPTDPPNLDLSGPPLAPRPPPRLI
jgi:hypothetical protein